MMGPGCYPAGRCHRGRAVLGALLDLQLTMNDVHLHWCATVQMVQPAT